MGLGPAKFFSLFFVFVLALVICNTSSIEDARWACPICKGISGGGYCSWIPERQKSTCGRLFLARHGDRSSGGWLLARNSHNREIGVVVGQQGKQSWCELEEKKIIMVDYYWPGMETGIMAGGCLPAIDTSMLLDGCWFATEAVMVV